MDLQQVLVQMGLLGETRHITLLTLVQFLQLAAVCPLVFSEVHLGFEGGGTQITGVGSGIRVGGSMSG